jgi:Tfp pilus assembly protein PilV
MIMHKKSLNSKGLSLVEVVLAAMLLAVVAAALFASYSNANNIIMMSKDKIIALTWAQSMLERSLSGTTATDPATPNWLTVEKTVLPATGIAEADEAALLTRIKATVSWRE